MDETAAFAGQKLEIVHSKGQGLRRTGRSGMPMALINSSGEPPSASRFLVLSNNAPIPDRDSKRAVLCLGFGAVSGRVGGLLFARQLVVRSNVHEREVDIDVRPASRYFDEHACR